MVALDTLVATAIVLMLTCEVFCSRPRRERPFQCTGPPSAPASSASPTSPPMNSKTSDGTISPIAKRTDQDSNFPNVPISASRSSGTHKSTKELLGLSEPSTIFGQATSLLAKMTSSGAETTSFSSVTGSAISKRAKKSSPDTKTRDLFPNTAARSTDESQPWSTEDGSGSSEPSTTFGQATHPLTKMTSSVDETSLLRSVTESAISNTVASLSIEKASLETTTRDFLPNEVAGTTEESSWSPEEGSSFLEPSTTFGQATPPLTKMTSSVGETTSLSSVSESAISNTVTSPSIEKASLERTTRGLLPNKVTRLTVTYMEQYIFSLLRIVCPENDILMQLFIATVTEGIEAEGLIYFPLHNSTQISFTLNPGVGEFINLPAEALPGNSRGLAPRRRENTTVVVAANEEIMVYGHLRCSQQRPNDTDRGAVRGTAFRIKGIKELGENYRLVTHQNLGHSQLAVVAAENETFVQIYFKNNSEDNCNVTLQIYETYIIESSSDITGTYITSSSPVFVLTGNNGDGISKTSGRDAFYECLSPFTRWGKRFHLFPPFEVTSNGQISYKIVPWFNTSITIKQTSSHANECQSCLVPNKQFDEITLYTFYNDTEFIIIESSEEILVAQFSANSAASLSMLLVPSVYQFTNNYSIFPVFNITHVDEEAKHFINVVLPPGCRANDLFINKNNSTKWITVATNGDGSTVVRTTLSPGSNQLENRGGCNITSVVSASHARRCYTFALG